MNWNFQEILIKDPSSAWGCDTSGNVPPCGVAVRRTCRCTEFHRVKNRKSASPVLHSCNAKTQICVTRPQCVNDLPTLSFSSRFTDSEGREFATQLGDSLFWLKILCLLSFLPGKFFGDYRALGHDCLHPHPFQFYIFQPSDHASADPSGRAV